jgi:hypothetical protein
MGRISFPFLYTGTDNHLKDGQRKIKINYKKYGTSFG